MICRNKKCSVSTGIHEGLTFGSGELDNCGYWSRPCYACAREHDATIKETRASIARDMRKRGESKRSVRRYIATSEWLWIPGHPFPKSLTTG